MGVGDHEISDVLIPDGLCQKVSVQPQFVAAALQRPDADPQQAGLAVRVRQVVGKPAGSAPPVDAFPAACPGANASEAVVRLGLLLLAAGYRVHYPALDRGCPVEFPQLVAAFRGVPNRPVHRVPLVMDAMERSSTTVRTSPLE